MDFYGCSVDLGIGLLAIFTGFAMDFYGCSVDLGSVFLRSSTDFYNFLRGLLLIGLILLVNYTDQSLL